jgi:hypothetical protein
MRNNAAKITKQQAAAYLWQAGDLQYKLWQQQEIIYHTIRKMPRDVQIVVVLCARQFGKSVLGTILATEDCLRNPDIVTMIIGPTIKQTRAIVRPRMKLIMRDCPDGLIKPVKSEDTWYFANGSELKLGGFDTNSGSERGKTLHKVYIEEIVESDPDSYLDFLRSDLGPALTHSKHAQIVYLTTLPKIPDHPFALSTVPEAEASDAFFKFTIHDNKKLSKEQYDSCVKMCGGEHTVDFRREYLCEQIRDSTIILAPEFDEKLHVRDCVLPEYANLWIGGDVGGVRDKSVFLLMAYDFERAKIMVLDERAYDPDTGSAVMVAGSQAMESEYVSIPRIKFMARYVDSDGQLRVDFMQQHNYPVALPRKDELETTVNQVRVALARCDVEISHKCKLLIRTLRSGTFNKQRTDLDRNSTMGHMDAFMALAYGLRHAIKSNPFPLYNGANPHTHYIDTSNPKRSRSAESLRSIFTVR